MTSEGTWNLHEGRVWRDTPAAEEANKDVLMFLQGCRANTTMPASSGCRRVPVPPGPACIALVLMCSLVQVPVAALQPPDLSPTATHLLRLHNSFKTPTPQISLETTVPSIPSEAPRGSWISLAKKAPQDQQDGSLPSEVKAATSATASLPSDTIPWGTPHAGDRAKRGVAKIRRIEMYGPPLPDRKTLFVEVLVLADYSLYKHYGRNGASQRAVELLSVANKVLGGVGVVLVPAEVRVWDTMGTGITATRRMESNVDRLQRYRLNLFKQDPDLPNDHTVLLTRKQMTGEVTCGAPLRGMCRRKESVSVVQDEGEGPSLPGVALAHQVGHSLGMEDDAEDPDHACRCHAATCVMSRHFRNASNPKLEWSTCSKESLSSVRDTVALDCLRNVPTRLAPSNICGDGTVDEGEQCDCGPVQFCDNPCCVASTCRLAVNASCASGSCCDTQTCQPRSSATMCRAALTECDLPEFCSGHSEYCPTDVTQTDGTPCHGGQGHCYNGQCGSREGRCEQLWGTSSSAASPDCYSKYNVKGSPAGNCGSQYGGVYRQCRPEDSLCGTLYCTASSSRSLLLQDHRNGSQHAGPHECYFISGSRDYPAQNWLVPNGASCGTGKMCVNQQCQDVPSPTRDCPGGCSGHGVCNSKGNCHCDVGYSPPDCSLAGLGGSADSNVMSGPSNVHAQITSIWVILVLLASSLAVICCSWGYFKGWYKRKGRDHISRVFPCCVACLDTCCCPIMTKAVRWMLTVRSSPEKKQSHRSDETDEGEKEDMLYSVDVDVKGTSQTNSWGVANEKLVTEVITVTPKNSPDLRRKVKLPSQSPDLHHKSQGNHQRPKYSQSISMDSGCVSDTDEDDSSKGSSLQLSMSSLLSTFRKIGNKNGRATPEREINPSRNFGSQKSIPLSRLVVDPLVGGRSSRQATPPPEHVRSPLQRSFSTDAYSTGRIQAGGTPLPKSPSAPKPTKSEENLSTSTAMPSHVKLPYRKESSPTDRPTQVTASPEEHTHRGAKRDAVTTNGRKVPLLPPSKKPLPSPPKIPLSRHNSSSPPHTTSHRNLNERLHEKCNPSREAPQPSLPSRNRSEAQKSSPETESSRGNSNKVMAMARKFEAS